MKLFGPDQAYVYAVVPPVTVTSISPVLFPKQSTSVTTSDTAKTAGSVIVVATSAVHPLASVTVTM